MIMIKSRDILCRRNTRKDWRHHLLFSSGDEEQQSEFDDMPKPDYKPPIPVPKEDAGTGCNSKVYFVCNERELQWHIFHSFCCWSCPEFVHTSQCPKSSFMPKYRALELRRQGVMPRKRLHPVNVLYQAGYPISPIICLYIKISIISKYM